MKLQTCYVVKEDTIEKTELLMPTRPFMELYSGVIAAWDYLPQEGDLIKTFRSFKENYNLVPLDHHSRQTILLPPMMRTKLLKDLKIANRIINDINQINRLGKLFAFTSEEQSYDIVLQGITWRSQDRDGTVLISKLCPGPRQVRALIFSPGDLIAIVKGIIRPPINNEPEGFVGDAQFGTPVQAGMVMRIYEVSSLAPQRASLNWQAAVFNYDSKSIGRALRKDQENLDKLTVIDCVPKEHREKCFYGIPAGLLINQLGPWKSLRKLRCGIARLPVFELEGIPLGSFAIGALTGIDLEDPLYPILRDPAKPDRSAIQNYLFHGYISHFHGIFFNPKEPLWKLQGGDFDGDYGIILRPEMLKQLPTLPTKTRFIAAPRTMPIVNNKPVYESALLSRLSSAENMIGAVVLESIRRFEIGQLNDERAIALAEICQASIDAIKHSRDNMAIRRAFKTITDERDEEFEFEFFVDQIAKITQATGFDEKKAAWEALGEWIKSHPTTRYHEQFLKRFNKLDSLLKDTGFLRGSRLQMPDVLKDMCNAHLLSYDSTEEVTLMKVLAKAYRDSVKAAGTALTDEQTEAAQEVISQCKAEITEAYLNRQVSTAALLAYCPPRLAAELVDVEELKQLRITSNSTVLAINLPIESRIYPVDEPQPCSPLEYQAFVAGYSQVRITVLETKDTYARCFLEVNQSDSIPFDPSQFADDDDIFA